MSRFRVQSVDSKNGAKRIGVVDDKGSKVVLSLHRYALVGKTDDLFIDPEHSNRVYVVGADGDNDLIPVTPHFEQPVALKVGDTEFPGKITELVTSEDIDSYNFLESFHYRTSSIAQNDDDTDVGSSSAGGRRAVLLLNIRHGLRWQPIGYIELHMPLLMVKPRHELFALPFKHPKLNVGWDTWDQHAMRANVNRIVRIARVVTSPEYRGLGVSRVLINAAKEFARSRWHVSGLRPLFMEISAEMLKYLDFVSAAGLMFAGNTEGNLQRVHKDLTYMRREYDVTSGIMSLQKKYLVNLTKGSQALGKSLDEMIQLLSEVAENPKSVGNLAPAEYYYLKSVLRFPIPYFICGLDSAAVDYIFSAIASLRVHSPEKLQRSTSKVDFKVKSGQISYSNISITTSFKLPASKHVQAIVDCFGLDGTELQARIVNKLNIEASGGNIIFITGPSGSGKSLLLSALDPSVQTPFVTAKYQNNSSTISSVGWIRDLPTDIPLIEYFADRWGMERALAALNQAGLSEAYVYLKPYQLLSRGQRYRARLADLALREDQVWLIDEFCADLDPMTAKIVANNLRKHVIKYQRIAIVAAANHDHYLDALKPTRIIRLRHGFQPEIMTYKDYIDEFHHKVG